MANVLYSGPGTSLNTHASEAPREQSKREWLCFTCFKVGFPFWTRFQFPFSCVVSLTDVDDIYRVRSIWERKFLIAINLTMKHKATFAFITRSENLGQTLNLDWLNPRAQCRSHAATCVTNHFTPFYNIPGKYLHVDQLEFDIDTVSKWDDRGVYWTIIVYRLQITFMYAILKLVYVLYICTEVWYGKK